MTEYQYRVSSCINDKLIEYSKVEAKSLYHIDLMYHHHITEIKTLFYKPHEHYTKILVLAYRKTIK